MEIELKGVTYSIGQMNVFDQWNVARRIIPLLGALSDLKDGASMIENLTPLLSSVGKMTDEDTSYILNKCLAVVKRKEPSGWNKVLGGKDAIMYEDMTMSTILRLTMSVITENMGDFFTDAASEDFTKVAR